MHDDILCKLRASFRMPNLILTNNQLKNYVLYELEQLFNASATTLQDHSLPMPDGQLLTEIDNKLLREELNYDLAELRSQHFLNFASLNYGQKVIYDLIIAAIFAKKQVLVFVHGHGGTGKTFLWHTIINSVRSESLIVVAVASFGIASLLLPNEGQNYNKDLPFGGKTILLGGDFRQILPVIPDGTKEQITNASLTSSSLWPKFIVLTLTENMHLSTDGLSSEEKAEITEFSEWILNVGNGQLSNLASLDESDDSFVTIPFDLLLENSCEPLSTIVLTIYPSICDIQVDPSYFRERAIVTTKNTTVAEKSMIFVDSIYTSSIESDDAGSLYPIEYINQLEFNGVPSHELALKVGTPVMLLRNISPSMGLCNGTRLIITQLSSKVIQAQIITGSNIGNQVFIPRIIFPINEIRCSFTIKRRQFPLKPCYAMTINKSQGQSLKIVGVFLKDQVFTHGQFYVTLSRVTSRKGLKIISCDNEGRPSTYAKNIGNAIQASAKGRNIQPFAASIIEGDYYQVCGFYTFENKYTNSVVAHEAVIDLKSDNKVTRINPMTPPIPHHYFTFIDFAHLLTMGKRSGLKILCRGEELRVTLWGDVAKSFDDSDLGNQSSPIITVFAAFRITEFKGKPNLASTVASLWYFNPEIQEILPYKHFYKDIPVEVHQLPSTMNTQTIDQQLKENRKTIKEILCMDPYQYKSQRFTDYDLHRGWWYHSCPICTKSISDKGTGFKCIEHNEVTPIPWFRVDCIVTDGTDVTTFLMVGKTAENFFGSSAHSYVYDKGFIDSIPTPMIDKLQKPKKFQLRFRTFRSIMNRCNIIVANVFDDIIEVESPQQHVEPEFHDINVLLMEQSSASSSAKPLC
uniref:ATP-dependent DNA helicase n=1 Tax=Salix viminalis TaxID=40686 RepID=A0A6N2NKL1_SALVM